MLRTHGSLYLSTDEESKRPALGMIPSRLRTNVNHCRSWRSIGVGTPDRLSLLALFPRDRSFRSPRRLCDRPIFVPSPQRSSYCSSFQFQHTHTVILTTNIYAEQTHLPYLHARANGGFFVVATFFNQQVLVLCCTQLACELW
jgi:hypothetical protein